MENIQEAIKILKSLGGDKNMLKVLETLESTQEHNEQLLVDATAQRKEATQMRDHADKLLREANQAKAQSGNDRDSQRILTETNKRAMAARESAVNAKTAALAKNTKEQNDALKTRENDLIQRTVGIEKRERVCNEREAGLNQLTNDYNAIGDLISKVANRSV